MNIGKWIVVAFVLFGGFIAALVTVCMKQDINLVSKDYYTEELAYQQQIVRVNNTKTLVAKPAMKIENNELQVMFGNNAVESGSIELFCPSNPSNDASFELSTNTSQHFSLKSLPGGMYRAKLKWTMNGKEYYQEEIIYL